MGQESMAGAVAAPACAAGATAADSGDKEGAREAWRAMPGVGTGYWRRKPRVLEALNVTAEDVALPIPAMLKEGLQKLWAVRAAMESPLEYTGEIPEELREVMAETGERRNESMWRLHEFDRPAWRVISGLGSVNDCEMSPENRSAALRKLLGAVLHFLKFEMDAADRARDDWRSYMWDPLPKVCLYFGISRAQLSRFSKEEMGLAAHELVDGIRIQKLRARLKESARAFVAAAIPELELRGRELALAVWTKLKASRKAPEWDRNAWAIGLGIPNYARMYRACLVLWGKTPAQVEFEEIVALCEELTAAAEEPTVKEEGVGQKRDEGECTRVQFFEGEQQRVHHREHGGHGGLEGGEVA